MPKNNPKIIYDHREEVSQIPAELTLIGIETKSMQLSLGDYIISDRIIVERKSGNDLAQSIMDGRLFDQAKRLIDTYETPVLIVEGDVPMKKAAFQGAIVSVIKNGISVLTVENTQETVEILNRMALSEVKEKRGPVVRKKHKKKNDPETTAIHALSMIPGISYKKSESLLNQFGSIKAIASLSEKDLTEVEGIGEKTADLIKSVLNFDFKADQELFKDRN